MFESILSLNEKPHCLFTPIRRIAAAVVFAVVLTGYNMQGASTTTVTSEKISTGTRKRSREPVNCTFPRSHQPLKSLQPFRHLPLPPPPSSLFLPPTRPRTISLARVHLLSASLPWHYNPLHPPALLPLHYVIMIIAHRGLRKLNFPFCSVIPAVSFLFFPSPQFLCRHHVCRPDTWSNISLMFAGVSLHPFPLKIERH